MQKIYLDNAATTRLSPEVLYEMMPWLTSEYGNPSSIHTVGRMARVAIEKARKSVAQILCVKPATIVFTSGGTESNNIAIAGTARQGLVKSIITSAAEHHSVLHPVEKSGLPFRLIDIDKWGRPVLKDLEKQLRNNEGTSLVTLMAANNEIGTITDIISVAAICKKHGAIFHTDAVQYIGHYPVNLSEIQVDLASASGHKFHGPIGTGILYVREGVDVTPLIESGGQERNLRSGTENVAGIVGFAKALEIAASDYEIQKKLIGNFREYLKKGISDIFEGVIINEDPVDGGLYSILSVSIPVDDNCAGIAVMLDAKGIAVSAGSACSAGKVSHVTKLLGRETGFETIRFSLSRYNKAKEIVDVLRALEEIGNK